MKRVKFAFRWFWAAMTKPQLFQMDIIRLNESMMKFLEETAKNERPMSCELKIMPIAKIDFAGAHLLTLWCGYAEKDNPIVRLRELADENAQLRSKLALLNSQKNSPKGSPEAPPPNSNSADKQRD